MHDGLNVAEPFVEAFGTGDSWQDVVEIADVTGATSYTLYKVPGQYIERPVALSYRLVTSAVVGNRVAIVDLVDGQGITLAQTHMTTGVAAGTTQNHSFWVGLGSVLAVGGSTQTAPLPDVFLSPGHQVLLTLNGGDAGDAISRIRLVNERHYTAGRHRPRRRRRLFFLREVEVDRGEDFEIETGTGRQDYYR